MASIPRIDFTKGVSAVTDPSLIGQGHAVILDNVDLEGITARSYRAPVFRQEVDDGIVDIFEYRGRWWFSSLRRDWAAEYVGGKERLYFKEEGLIPQIIVDGVQAQLGTIRPIAAPLVAETDAMSPTRVEATLVENAGSLSAGSATYRIGYRTKWGLARPGGQVTISTKDKSAVRLEWNKVTLEDVVKIVIYGRSSGHEQIIDELDVSETEFLDSGSKSPVGQFANQLDEDNVFWYFYTYIRKVNGYEEESGPSPTFGPLNTFKGRKITRYPTFDGLFKGQTIYPQYTVDVLSIDLSQTTRDDTITGRYQRVSGRMVITTSTAHSLETGDEVGIVARHGAADTGTDTNTKNQIYNVSTFADALSKPTITAFIDSSETTPDPFTVGTVLRVRIVPFRGLGYADPTGEFADGDGIAGGAPAEGTKSDESTLTTAGGKRAVVRWSCAGEPDGYHVYLNDKWKGTVGKDTFYLDFGSDTPGEDHDIPTTDTSQTHVFTIKKDTNITWPTQAQAISGTPYWGWLCKTVETVVTFDPAFPFDTVLEKGDLVRLGSFLELDGYYTLEEDASTDSFKIKVLTELNDTASASSTGVFQTAVDAAKYLSKWRLYVSRGDVGGSFSEQGEYDLSVVEVLDSKPADALGGTCSTDYYETNASGVQIHVVHDLPPVNLRRLTLHNNSLWGIVDRTVCASPINRPGAFPKAYRWDFPSEPLQLSSYAGTLLVHCTDGTHRMDGQDPSSMSANKTLAEDGLVGPFTPQPTPAGLIHLTKRGLMAWKPEINGSVPISEGRIESSLLTAGSSFQDEFPFWMVPTRMSAAWAKLTKGMPAADPERGERHIDSTLTQVGPLEDIRSFYWKGKYYLYYINGDRYGYHGMVVVDCSKSGYPITFLGFRPRAAHVTERGQAFLLLQNPRTFTNGFGVYHIDYTPTGGAKIDVLTEALPGVSDVDQTIDSGNHHGNILNTIYCYPAASFDSFKLYYKKDGDENETLLGTYTKKQWEKLGSELDNTVVLGAESISYYYRFEFYLNGEYIQVPVGYDGEGDPIMGDPTITIDLFVSLP